MLVTPRIARANMWFNKTAWNLAVTAFPVKVHNQMLCQLPKMGKQSVVQNMISLYTRGMIECGVRRGDANVHVGVEEGELLKVMLDAGLQRDGIPTTVGGSWMYAQVLVWCRIQARAERKLENRQRQKARRRTVSTTAREPDTANLLETRPTEESRSTLRKKRSRNAEEQKTANALYARRKREKKKVEQMAMQHECDKSAQENRALLEENARLQDLWQQALLLVQSTDRDYQRDERPTSGNIDQESISNPLHKNPTNSNVNMTSPAMESTKSIDSVSLPTCDNGPSAKPKVGSNGKTFRPRQTGKVAIAARVIAQKKLMQSQQDNTQHEIVPRSDSEDQPAPIDRTILSAEPQEGDSDKEDEMGHSFADNQSIMEASILPSIADDSMSGDINFGGDFVEDESIRIFPSHDKLPASQSVCRGVGLMKTTTRESTQQFDQRWQTSNVAAAEDILPESDDLFDSDHHESDPTLAMQLAIQKKTKAEHVYL
mmetsp:Transcript_36636/g.76263  ORF Transcript_36636/g.76263 Transcript_36636/m.76263 type:complete len:487 (-) Transcript_36636:895-2355(-)